MEHTHENDVCFRNVAHVERVATKLKEEEIHLGSENTVFSLQGFGSSPHHSLPVVSFSSCKTSNPRQQELVIRTVSACFFSSHHFLSFCFLRPVSPFGLMVVVGESAACYVH